jgi:SAM-dependent methyltransferase
MKEEDYYADPNRYEAECGFFTTDLEWYRNRVKKLGGPVLVLGCGTGRVLLDLAINGHTVDGLDISSTMLDKARSKLTCASPEITSRIRLWQMDMRSFDLADNYNVILAPLNALMHLHTDQEALSCFKKVYQHLKDDGRFIFDVTNPLPQFLEETQDPQGEPLRNIWVQKICYLQTEYHSYDPHSQISETRFFYYPQNQDVEPFSTRLRLRMFSPKTIETLLSQAGFTANCRWGGFSGDIFNKNSSTQIVESKKDE